MRSWRLALVVVLVVIVQVTVMPHLRILGVVPDLGLVLAVAVVYRDGAEAGAITGFAAGLGYDLFLATPLGLSALVYALTAYAVGVLQTGMLRSPRWIPPLLGGLGRSGRRPRVHRHRRPRGRSRHVDHARADRRRPRRDLRRGGRAARVPAGQRRLASRSGPRRRVVGPRARTGPAGRELHRPSGRELNPPSGRELNPPSGRELNPPSGREPGDPGWRHPPATVVAGVFPATSLCLPSSPYERDGRVRVSHRRRHRHCPVSGTDSRAVGSCRWAARSSRSSRPWHEERAPCRRNRPRGRILDRNGTVLIENVAEWAVTVDRQLPSRPVPACSVSWPRCSRRSTQPSSSRATSTTCARRR